MACTGETMQPLPAGNVAGHRNTAQPDDSAPSEAHKLANGGISGSPEAQDEAGASSGESITEEQGVKNKQTGKGCEMPAPAPKPSCQAKSEGADRKQQEQQRGKEGRAEKCTKLPRPEGIAHCPRCASEDTKFCYYNNYNIKQPRYFCKGCQRYWTAGGTLRNVPVGAGRRKNKNAAAREGDKGKVGGKAHKEGGFPVPPFGPLMLDPGLAYPPLAPGKGGLPGFVPNLAMVGQLNPLGVPGFQSIVDPAAAAVAAALPTRLAAGVDPMQFITAAAAPCSSQRTSGSAAGEDGSHSGRRVRMRRDSGPHAHPADSSQHGSASTATEMPGPMGDMHSSRGEHLGGQMGSPGDASAAGLSGFQAFPSGPGSGGGGSGGGYVQTPALSAAMMQQQDWFSMAAAANQQQQQQVQAAAAQQQFQYQAAAMQAQAMQAAAGAWSQGSNPYLSGLCFPYNLYGAGSQWAAAYASLGAQPWPAMDVAGGQGNGNTGGQCAVASNGMTQPSPALLVSQGGGNSSGWSNGGINSWSMGGGGNMGGVNVWPTWPSQSGSMSGSEPQAGSELLHQQQQQVDMSNLGQHGSIQHGSGLPHGSGAYHGTTLHGAGSSMFSGGSSGASHLSNLTGLDTIAANGHHHSHSLDTGS